MPHLNVVTLWCQTARPSPPFLPPGAAAMAAETADFYVRYYVGHKGKFGHEFLEFEFRPDGKVRGACERTRVCLRSARRGAACAATPRRGAQRSRQTQQAAARRHTLMRVAVVRVRRAAAWRAQLRYANNSNYKNDTLIRKEVYVTPSVLAEVKRIVQDSEVRARAASQLPCPNSTGNALHSRRCVAPPPRRRC